MSDLSASYRGQVATAQVLGTVRLTNNAAALCVVDGYPGLTFVGENGNDASVIVDDDLSPGPSEVLLRPGGAASFRMLWGNGIGLAQPACVKAARFRVSLPGAGDTLHVEGPFSMCSGSDHKVHVSVSALLAGDAS